MRQIASCFVFLLACLFLSAAQQNGKAADIGIGNPSAPIRIDLYSDFQCPACKVLHDQTLEPLIVNYVNAGKVYLVFRQFPLPMHVHAREAASYACAAQKIGKYQQVGDQLFRTQESWASSGDVAGTACSVLSPSEAKRVRALAASPEIASEIENDIHLGQAEKVNATPTMIITRMIRRFPVSGPVSYPVLSKFLDSILN